MMCKFFRRIVSAAVLLLVSMLVSLPQGNVEAASKSAVHELNYFKSYETKVEGQDAFRIEIGMDRDNLDYQVIVKNYVHKQLVLDMKNTKPGKLKKEIKLNNPIAKRLTISELERHHTQVAIDLGKVVSEENYNVHVEKADHKEGKPYRLVVDIFAEPRTAGENFKGVKGRTIVLDPGHGGSDSGAVGPTGLAEKTATLAVSKKVKSMLESSGARVVMTRDRDVDVYGPNASDRQELQARVNVGEYTPGADIFVSIHCNAFSNPAAKGMETYYYPGSARGEQLATYIYDELLKDGGLAGRGVRTANFYVIKHSSMPATLLELAFITNPREESLLGDDKYQTTLAKAIVRGISRYFGE